jgi:hypothetical protein
MTRAVVMLAQASGLLILFAAGFAEAACTNSEIKATARGGIDALTVSWHVQPACDVAETGLMLGQEITRLNRVGAAILRRESTYSARVPVFETGVYWVVAYVVDTAGNMITSEPEFAPVLVFDDDAIDASLRAPSRGTNPI